MTFLHAYTKAEADRYQNGPGQVDICFHVDHNAHMSGHADKIQRRMTKLAIVDMSQKDIKRIITEYLISGKLNFFRGQYVVIVNAYSIRTISWYTIQTLPEEFIDLEYFQNSNMATGDLKSAISYLEYLQNKDKWI